MRQRNYNTSPTTLKTKSPYLLAVAAAFFLYELYLLLNSFSADYQIYSQVSSSLAARGFSMWPIYWLSSEFVGEVGLIVRFAGACFFLAFTAVLFRRKELSLSYLRKGLLLEAIQYLFFIPFITYLTLRPSASTVTYEAALSYSIQLALITPLFLYLYSKLKKPTSTTHLARYLSIAVVSFTFALWAKHFIFSLYALPINLQDPILLVGSLNSAIPLLAAAFILLFVFLPVIRGNRVMFNSAAVGLAFILVGVYFVVFLLISTVNSGYMWYVSLTELWAVSALLLGVGLLIQKNE